MPHIMQVESFRGKRTRLMGFVFCRILHDVQHVKKQHTRSNLGVTAKFRASTIGKNLRGRAKDASTPQAFSLKIAGTVGILPAIA